MEEQKVTKIGISKILLIIAMIIIAIMGFFIYKLNNEKNDQIEKYNDLQVIVSDLNNTIESYQSKMNRISETISSENTNDVQTDTNTSKSDDIKYEITKKKNQYGDESIAVIKATKAGQTITKEFEMDAQIVDTGTMSISPIGSVAMVADSAGEYYGVNFYQLVNDEIKKIGAINCGADMVKEATYSVETKGETTVSITANRNGELTKKDFEMTAAIAKTEVVDVLDCGKVVLVAETGGEYYAFKVFRLSQDYTNGKTNDIIEVGSISYIL